jgi:hypothetical protein
MVEQIKVNTFENNRVEIEFKGLEKLSIEIKKVDPLSPPEAIYEIKPYISEEKTKITPFEYDIMWIIKDGTMVKRGEDLRKHREKYRKD